MTNNFLPFQKYTLAIGTMLRKSLVCCSWAPNIERKGKRTISSIQTHVLMFYTMLKKVKNCSCRVLLQSIGQKGNKQLADIQVCLEQLFSMLSKWSTVKIFKKDVTQTLGACNIVETTILTWSHIMTMFYFLYVFIHSLIPFS